MNNNYLIKVDDNKGTVYRTHDFYTLDINGIEEGDEFKMADYELAHKYSVLHLGNESREHRDFLSKHRDGYVLYKKESQIVNVDNIGISYHRDRGYYFELKWIDWESLPILIKE